MLTPGTAIVLRPGDTTVASLEDRSRSSQLIGDALNSSGVVPGVVRLTLTNLTLLAELTLNFEHRSTGKHSGVVSFNSLVASIRYFTVGRARTDTALLVRTHSHSPFGAYYAIGQSRLSVPEASRSFSSFSRTGQRPSPHKAMVSFSE